MTKTSKITLILFSLMAIIIFICLGAWQVQRLQWKNNLIQDLEQKLQESPVFLEKLSAVEQFQRIIINGRILDKSPLIRLISYHNRQQGYDLLTPVILTDGRAVLVNLGWLPKDQKLDIEQNIIANQVGVIRFYEKKAQFIRNNLQENRWYYLSHLELQQYLDLDIVDYFVVLESSYGLQPSSFNKVMIYNHHLSYVITWYGLAVVTVIMLIVFFKLNQHSSGI